MKIAQPAVVRTRRNAVKSLIEGSRHVLAPETYKMMDMLLIEADNLRRRNEFDSADILLARIERRLVKEIARAFGQMDMLA